MNRQEKNNDRTAWTVSILVHALLLIAFIFMVAWREPNPPLPEYGIQINFGTDDVGSGDIQPTEPANTSESEEESDPAPAEEVVEEQPVDETAEEVVAEEVTEAISAEPVPTETITQAAPSPDVIDKEPVPEKEVEVKVKEENTEVVEKPVEEVQKEPAKTPVLYEKKETNTTDGTGESDSEAQKANEGNDKDEIGDKGQEDGVLDERSIYKGNQGGGGGGPTLKISGWYWDDEPNKKDSSSENGIIEFSFIVDDSGEVIRTEVIQSTLSPSVTNFYKQQLQNITFSQTNPNVAPSSQTKGTVKFVIKSK